MSSRVCLMTFSILRAPYGDSRVREFDDRTPDVFLEAEQSPGFIDRARPVEDIEWMSNYQKDWGRWGPFAVPRFYLDGIAKGHSTQAQTISIWQDLESVFRFAYQGSLHKEALRMRKDWFGKQNWPIYVVWWIDEQHQPNWREACHRLEHLHDHGSTPYAFSFKTPFDATGQHYKISRP
ncbi:DUF3291 domain-containing protein [Photobacterium sp. WH77]|uniref:DUF3291 domain-containing protein n=1 Tax=unclassified Photobacterium TaxID=2628852 RepID=UPI001C497C10|nr:MULTISPECIES: DUF3291 domain-containing protein [unclassified Photobacterium]MBV7262651.1 DUF3291 domain-containing protein [Photobacterium sp. WH24]MCG2837780.1 DUF3291 domain-containing protein [Photobacterium sp. WH77]MCG2845396.1 DUF3291 domain-containing protein [Photobacterium sp. WH80]MDO6582178.1 DUF3291 domain-containing protein [Photobacterium sp. 2_MG-2023]